MYTKAELCKKITDIYPEIGECGIDIDVSYDDEKKAWVVDLIKDSHELKHYLDLPGCWGTSSNFKVTDD